jgi:hypothetical protein
MPARFIWVHEAEPEDEGSFCDTGSKHNYHNVDGFTKESISRDAGDRGESVYSVGSSKPGELHDVDDRFNLFYTEEDSRGEQHPRYYEPGR